MPPAYLLVELQQFDVAKVFGYWILDISHAHLRIVDDNVRAANWGAVLAIALCVFSIIAAEMLPAAVLTPMAKGLGISDGVAGQTVSLTAFVAIIAGLFAGVVVGAIDRRKVLLGYAAILVIANIMTATAAGTVSLMAARGLLGWALGGFWSMAASVTIRLVPHKDIPKALSIVMGAVSVGMVVAAPLGSFLGEIVGWRGVFSIAGAIGVIAFAGIAITVPPLPTRAQKDAMAVFRILRLPGVPIAIAAVFCLFAGQLAFFTYMRPYLERVTQFDLDEVSLALLTFGATTVVGTALSSMAVRSSLKATMAFPPIGIAICAAVLLMFASSPAAVFTAIALWGFCFGFIPVGWQTWVTRNSGDDVESGGGLHVASVQFANTLGAGFGGVTLNTGGPYAPIGVAGVLMTLAFVIIFLGVGKSSSQRAFDQETGHAS
ncbi:MFS transporter [Rhizobium sp. P38BS-XIX]|uniref:MFS transporter n=1 Tax=Rhizobium sp. P38BS-XIX TaxID=2726740 RepID=UPI001456BBCD|nr:MFS transporter [Rhizobium sp. P38BS-XIX]NLR99910.1 MFS transporter [Rhizobium sp. P38BS-XIX]